MDPLTSQPSQEYPIRALVRANNDIGLPRKMEGVVTNWRHTGSDMYDSEDRGYMALEANLIIDPTPQQIAEERAKAGLPAEPSEGKKDLEPVREDAHRSPSGSERIYRTPAGLLLRMLQIGEVVQKGDFTWLKQGSVEEEDPILAGAGVGRTVTAEMGNNYYRPIQGAAEGEALPEAPAEGSQDESGPGIHWPGAPAPSLPQAGTALGRFRMATTDYMAGHLSATSWMDAANAAQAEHPDYVAAVMERFKMSKSAAPSAPSAPNPIGYALAMRVLQSDLYAKLDDEERGECDAFIKAGAAPSVTMGGDKDEVIAELAHVLRKVVKWNSDYPSNRIFSEGEIRKIAKKMDDINEEAVAALSKLEGR